MMNRRQFFAGLAALVAAPIAALARRPGARRGFLPQRIPILTPEQFRKAYIEPAAAVIVAEWERKYCAHFPPYPIRVVKPAQFS